MKKLSPMGIGPKIGRVVLPFLVVTVILTMFYPEILSFGPVVKKTLLIAGSILFAIGLMLYAVTVKYLLTGIRNARLMTTGPYKYSQNPLYAVMILFMVPGIALFMNSWIALITSVIAYIIFKINIHKEYEEMERVFGDEYREYRKKTPEFFLF